ncbi:MAG TPA: lysophospholipid acyltransferase family protein [Chthoniobacterales bacterium]
MSFLRAATRLLLLTGLVLASLPAGFGDRPSAQRARWMQRLSRRILRVLGATVEIRGEIPSHGLVVSNHLGYLDVFVIGSVVPAIFVAKSDVRDWPVVGLLCQLAGTLFVDRDRRLSVSANLPAIRAALDSGLPVVIFPEGTSSDGATVLPFKASLLGAGKGHLSTPAAIAYDLPGGSVADELCYWRDMTFGPHFWNVLGKRGFRARLHFGPQRPPAANRKILAQELHAEIAVLRNSAR